VSITKDNEDNIYLILSGIKWQPNLCNSSDEEGQGDEENEESVSRKNIPPMEVELLYDEKELTLQNGLNSSEFVPSSECCEYYIHLLKK
jgi:hypothetical protein